MLVRLEKASDGKHKWIAHFSDGTKTRFGAFGMPDYTLTGDKERRTAFRQRHARDLRTKDPQRAGFLAMFLLWGDSTSLQQNVKDYNRRFYS